MTFIHELIDIPERVLKGDFVLNLMDSLSEKQAVLRDYVVTEQLAQCFDNALGFLRGGLESGKSKAAYLHGSFGSGKSHFMAVLNLLLQGEPAATSLPAFAPAMAQHGGWLRQGKLLLVPYHMLDAPSLEARILGGYREHLLRIHPEAPQPLVFRSDALLRNAEVLRQRMGDAAYFANLKGPQTTLNWGSATSAASWTAARYEAVLALGPGSPEFDSLVTQILSTYFPEYASIRGRETEAYIDLDAGLAEISRHAQALGYRGVVLFLDELMLWLMSRRSDSEFISVEGAKISKLVEATAARPVPILSFIARQRALTELIGEHLTGSDQISISQMLSWWEGRFHTITLEDRNLPEIAGARVLRPRDAAARTQLQTAFDMLKLRPEVESVLLTSQGEREMFRKIYPFTPALLQALVALSAALQRERTALKVMFQLLVNRRADLRLGDLIPLGDLYDALAEEVFPFSDAMKSAYDNAQRLYLTRFRPLILAEHGLSGDAVVGPEHPSYKRFHGDDLLAKSLLLAALVPEVPCFKNLTAAKLSALNPGLIQSPLPGREVQFVLQKLASWAGVIGELKVPDGSNPEIRLELTGVDIDQILEKVHSRDTHGERRLVARQLLYQDIGFDNEGTDFIYHLLWRNSPRTVQIVQDNVRQMATSNFRNEGPWKIIIDLPFDDEKHSPQDDFNKVESVIAEGIVAQTAIWLPLFLSQDLLSQLGKLVKIRYLFQRDDIFRSHTAHLNELDRLQARSVLENLRSRLETTLRTALRGAYGLETPVPGSLSNQRLPYQVKSLTDKVKLELPVGATLKEGVQHLIHQIFEQEYPDHPLFEEEIKVSNVRNLYELAQKALLDPNRRIPIERKDRKLLSGIAVPLGLAHQAENALALRDDWDTRFEKFIHSQRGELTVGDLRAATDLPRPRGLSQDLQNLLILLYCEAHNYSLVLQGNPLVLDPKRVDVLDDRAVLRREALPEPAQWLKAQSNAAKLFGLSMPTLCTIGTLTSSVKEIREHVRSLGPGCKDLVTQLQRAGEWLEVAACNRLATAEAASVLVSMLQHKDAREVIRVLAEASGPTTLEAMAKSLSRAAVVAAKIESTNWQLVSHAWRLTGELAVRGAALRERLVEAFSHDQLACPLEPVLDEAGGEATHLLARAAALATAAAPIVSAPVAPVAAVRTAPAPAATPSAMARQNQSAEQVRDLLAELERQTPAGSVLRLNLSWTYEARS